MNKSSRRTVIFGAIAGLSGIVTLSKTQAKQLNNAEMPKMLLDRAEIIDAVNIIGLGADLRDWKSCRAAFADKVLTDYTSLNGGTPNTVQVDNLIAGWQEFFNKTFKATQHMITNHAVKVNKNTATCTSLFQAHHVYLDTAKGSWSLGGYYNHTLARINERWKVTEMKMTWTWEQGTRPG